MNDGVVAEFDTPERLLQNKGGVFTSLVAAAHEISKH